MVTLVKNQELDRQLEDALTTDPELDRLARGIEELRFKIGARQQQLIAAVKQKHGVSSETLTDYECRLAEAMAGVQ